KDAPLDRAVESAGNGWLYSTQICVVPKHMLVHGAVFDRFLERFAAAVPHHSTTMAHDRDHGVLAPVKQIPEFFEALDEVRSIGEIVTGGYRMAADGQRD